MKKTPIICIILVLSILLPCMNVPVFAQQSANSCHSILAQQALDGSDKKLDTAKVVILYEMTTDTMVYSYNADKQINPTGLVKLLTVLIALEMGDLDEMVKVRQSTLNTIKPGSVSAGLKAGEELPLRDLLKCIMVSSANDACAVVAAHLGENQAGFVEIMNTKAAQLGCTGSHFTNAHGLTDKEQYSTARDLAIITLAALENPLFRELFGMTGCTIDATNKSDARKLKTTNNMMREGMANYDKRITGGKPAAATTTDRSMICTAKVGAAEYLCVVISAKGQVSDDGLVILRYGIFEEVSALLDYASSGFAVRQILDDSEVLYQFGVENGKNDVLLRPAQDISVVLPVDCDSAQLHFERDVQADLLKAPIERDQKMGTVTIRYGALVMGYCDLLSVTAVQGQDVIVQDTHREDVPRTAKDNTMKQWITYGLVLLLAVGVVFIVGYVCLQAWRGARIRAQHRRRARKRKRSR